MRVDVVMLSEVEAIITRRPHWLWRLLFGCRKTYTPILRVPHGNSPNDPHAAYWIHRYTGHSLGADDQKLLQMLTSPPPDRQLLLAACSEVDARVEVNLPGGVP